MSEKVLMKGNEALGEAALRAGCRHFFGYPITPQTELSAYLSKKMPKVGGTFLQAESEIAAINMVLGAAGSGVRAMTSSSSPGISLKSEGVSYIAGSDVPAVIINVQRGGPGLGSIQPSQSDYWQATKALGHGDFQLFVLAPSTVQEMADFVALAFETAEKYRMPAMILSDGMLGQMMEPVVFPDSSEVHEGDKSWAACGHQNKRPHNVVNSLYIEAKDLEKTVVERFERYEKIKANEQRSESYLTEDADIVVVAFGASSRVSRSAVNAARAKGIKAGLFRPVTLWPYPEAALEKTVPTAKKYLVVEMNMGQMIEDVKLVVNGRKPVEFFGRTGGVIPTPGEILEAIEKM
ncbi:MAG: 3-methyl-2-oxobutanoate dehydrogenase subunit VorB [Lachnospiraceae bacterium]|nr:3-methyl-2-oxobutanoate dehydrogenase subunit VorB [Lachnospiraceae bacterium]